MIYYNALLLSPQLRYYQIPTINVGFDCVYVMEKLFVAYIKLKPQQLNKKKITGMMKSHVKYERGDLCIQINC